MPRAKSGRFTKRRSRRTSKYKNAVDIPNVAMGLITANAATNALFSTDAISFVADGWLRPRTAATDNSFEVNMMELFQGKYGSKAYGTNLGDTIKYNLDRNLMTSIGSVVIAGIGFNVAKKMGLNKMLNKSVRSLGAGKVVKF